MDTKAIRRTLSREIKRRMLGRSPYGRHWKVANNDWYLEIHNSNHLLHEDFRNFFKSKKDVKTVLEVGCGTGIYPIKYNDLFKNISYTGLDISEDAIDYCKKNSSFSFISGDFIKMEIREKYDLVYSHGVVDHVYDIDTFISKIVQISEKYSYITSYRGYFPELKGHKMMWRDDDGCYYNDVSIKQTKENLLRDGLKEDEFIIRPQENGSGITETIIEVNKKH